MRILYVTECFPYPLDNGGNVRSYHILAGLSAEHEVTIVSGTAGEVSKEHVQAVVDLGAQVLLVPREKRSLMSDMWSTLQAFFTGRSVLLARHFRQSMLRSLLELFDSRRLEFDVIHFNHLDAATYASMLPVGPCRVVDQHNVVSRQLITSIPSERDILRRFAMWRDLRPLAREEREICNRMNLCFACSSTDAEALREMGICAPIEVVPNGVDTEYFGSSWAPSLEYPEVVFVGTLDYQPCEIAVWDFATEILPVLQAMVPEVRFIVVGRNPSSRLKKLAERNRSIELTGRVDDVRSFMGRARVAVVPLRSGSGTRLKILEAFSIGLPVVSTTIGAEGIEAVDGVHLLIADSNKEFAASVYKLIEDPRLARRIGDAGRELAVTKYSWLAVQLALCTAYRSLSGVVKDQSSAFS